MRQLERARAMLAAFPTETYGGRWGCSRALLSSALLRSALLCSPNLGRALTSPSPLQALPCAVSCMRELVRPALDSHAHKPPQPAAHSHRPSTTRSGHAPGSSKCRNTGPTWESPWPWPVWATARRQAGSSEC